MKKVTLFALIVCLLFHLLPSTALALENEIDVPQEAYSTEDYLEEIEEKKKTMSEFEVESLREANVKHFYLADGSMQAVVYGYNVHEFDEETGKWVECSALPDAVEDGALPGGAESNGVVDPPVSPDPDPTPEPEPAQALDDTYIDSANPSKNYNSIKKMTVSDSKIVYISFALPTLPAAATVSSANLKFYFYSSGNSYGMSTVGIYSVENNWSADTLTWSNSGTNNSLAATAATSISMASSASLSASNPRATTANITSLVKSWYEGKPNYGLALKKQSGVDIQMFSFESGPLYQPRYTVNYTTGGQLCSNGIYYFKNVDLDAYMQLDDNRDEEADGNGVHTELHSFDGYHDQQWKITYLHTGYYTIRSVETNMYLSVQSGKENLGDDDSFIVQESTYAGEYRKQWKFTSAGNGQYKMTPRSAEGKATDWCMAAGYSLIDSNVKGRNVEQRDYAAVGAKGLWFMEPLDSFLFSFYPIKADDIKTFSSMNAFRNALFAAGYNNVEMTTGVDYGSECLADLKKAKVFVSHGHGYYTGSTVVSSTYILLNNTKNEHVYYQALLYSKYAANLYTRGEYIQETDRFNKLELAIFIGCNTSGTLFDKESPNSLPGVVVNQGATAAVGFNDEIDNSKANDWLIACYKSLLAGNTIVDAVDAGRSASGLEAEIFGDKTYRLVK